MLDLTQVRHTLHATPELGFEEHRTGERVGGWLAELDGLAITERTGLPFASTRDGFMHACGHEVHTTCGPGSLERVLATPRRQSYVLLFQPAEEGGGGAKRFYDEGWLAEHPIDEFYALHVSPAYDPGVFATRHEIADGVAHATGTTVDVEALDSAYVPLVDDPGTTAKLMDWLTAREGVRFEVAPLTMTSEDFSYLAAHIPSTMVWLGVGGDEPLHSDRFAPDDAVIGPAVETMAAYLLRL